jgi:hypothetical protein
LTLSDFPDLDDLFVRRHKQVLGLLNIRGSKHDLRLKAVGQNIQGISGSFKSVSSPLAF